MLPLRPREKSPAIRGWQRFCTETAGPHLLRQWMRVPDANIGVCLGPASGVTALDFDEDADGLHGRIVELVGDSPVKKAGRRGYTAFYRFGGERSRHYSSGKVSVLDVLATGRQTVVPASVHPEGANYRWLTERTLENTPAGELPELRPEAMAEVARLLRPAKALFTPRVSHRGRMADALRCISPDVPYPVWRDVGMALKDELGEAGFPLWVEWSAGGEKYPGSEQARRVWDSFRGEGIHAATLFYHAVRHGYRVSR
ncbi:PriCT-2 domain-containing protein [Gemmata sp. G18]|uniref:PriCT-2 domain-containing protein n=1 Tax=Gemmata palustris TaxID=2822762 RepID=A0ABS5BP14_9BACT|nr:PriCT-2 domain-containing protein [Gemmata palustris]